MFFKLKVYGGRLGDALLPPCCTLCGCATEGALLCLPCTADLPWNTRSCPGCALPQISTSSSTFSATSSTGDISVAQAPRLLAEAALCPACLRRPRAFDRADAAFVLRAPVQQAIHALKYQAKFFQSPLLASAAAMRLGLREQPLPTLLIPVPLHWRRQWQRGYNQSLELARVYGQALGIAVDGRCAVRRLATVDQIGQTAAQRRKNLHGAFAVSARVKGQHVACIDDVMTTGATLEELARACKTAGAASVEAWAIARQPLGRSSIS